MVYGLGFDVKEGEVEDTRKWGVHALHFTTAKQPHSGSVLGNKSSKAPQLPYFGFDFGGRRRRLTSNNAHQHTCTYAF